MLTVHEAQTEILVWLWNNDCPIFDREALEVAMERDGPWELTFRGYKILDERPLTPDQH